MEVLKEKVEVLSNYEVLALLGDVLASDGGAGTSSGDSKHHTTIRHRHKQNLATIAYETTKYLEGTPCNLQNDAVAKQFLKAVDKFNLTKTEKLQLLNLRPTTPVEINLLISECEERLTEDAVTELLAIIADLLPGTANDEMADKGDDAAAMEEETANS